MRGVGITYLWSNKKFPPFIRLEGKRGDYEVYTPERTCKREVESEAYICSECGGSLPGWAKLNYCPNCGAKVVGA